LVAARDGRFAEDEGYEVTGYLDSDPNSTVDLDSQPVAAR
jgi:hypothetical protein